jgi:hypothetical protein
MTQWEISLLGPRGGFQVRQYASEKAARSQFERFAKKGYRARLWSTPVDDEGMHILGSKFHGEKDLR